MRLISKAAFFRLFYIACHASLPACFFLNSAFQLFVSAVIYLILQTFGVGIGLHRYFAHKSFSTGKAREWLLAILASMSGMGSPVSWAGLHRLHHAAADGPLDPHCPRRLGVLSILTGLYNTQTKIPYSYARDLYSKKALLFCHKNYFKILGCFALTAFILQGLEGLLFMFCLPIVLVYWVTQAGIVLNHTWGYRNFDTPDQSVNSIILSILTLGDGWHNNHHRFPEKFKHGYLYWEWDLQALLIRLFFLKKKAACSKKALARGESMPNTPAYPMSDKASPPQAESY